MASAPASSSPDSWPGSIRACGCCSASARACGLRAARCCGDCPRRALGFIETHLQFYVLRVLIGVAEGGLAPGIVLYLSQFADRTRARHHLHDAGAGHSGLGDHRRAAVGLAAGHGARPVRSPAGASCSWPRPCPRMLAGIRRAVLFSGHAGRGANSSSTDEQPLAAAPMPRGAPTRRDAMTGPCCASPSWRWRACCGSACCAVPMA